MSQSFIVNIGGTQTTITVDIATEAKQDTLISQIGEVQANPTQYSLLDRLKAIYTALTGILTFKIDQTTDGVTNLVAAKQSGSWAISNTTFAATQSGTWNINSIATLPALPSGSNVIGKFGIDQTTDGVTNLVAAKQSGSWAISNTTFAATQSGTWNIDSISTLPAMPAGTNVIGKVGIDQTAPGTTNLVESKQNGAWDVAVDEFAINNVEEASATVTYVGKEKADGTWYVMKVDTSSGTSISHASVSNNPSRTSYTLGWTNRATLTYNNYSSAF